MSDHDLLVLERLLDEDILVPAGGMAAVVCIVLIVMTGKTIVRTSRERTKREVAAYIAEGSMTPEQGERLLRAGARQDMC